jgi:hypothetical protein
MRAVGNNGVETKVPGLGGNSRYLLNGVAIADQFRAMPAPRPSKRAVVVTAAVPETSAPTVESEQRHNDPVKSINRYNPARCNRLWQTEQPRPRFTLGMNTDKTHTSGAEREWHINTMPGGEQ